MATTPFDRAQERKGQLPKAFNSAAAAPAAPAATLSNAVNAAKSGQQSAAGNVIKATQEVAASKTAQSAGANTPNAAGLMARVEKTQQNLAAATNELKKKAFDVQDAMKKAQSTPPAPNNNNNNGFKR